jgi:hypothetical protein
MTATTFLVFLPIQSNEYKMELMVPRPNEQLGAAVLRKRKNERCMIFGAS